MKQNRKLAILIPSLGGGGAERSMYKLANELCHRNVSVDLVVATSDFQYIKFVDKNVNLVTIGSKRQLSSFLPLLCYLNQNKPDVVLSALVTMNIMSVLLKIISRQKFDLFISERAVASLSILEFGMVAKFIIMRSIRVLYPVAKSVIAVSNDVAIDLESNFNIPSEKIITIYNPVVDENSIQQSSEIFEYYHFIGNSSVVISIGRFVPQKNFKLLVDAFYHLVKRGLDIKLVILGEGPLRYDLTAYCAELGLAERICFPGFVDNPFVWLKNSSVYVCSSNYEGLPGGLIQAMSVGLPVVSTNCPGGSAEVLEFGKWGRLVPLGSAKFLCEAILETLCSQSSPDVLSRSQAFSVGRSVECYAQLLGVD